MKLYCRVYQFIFRIVNKFLPLRKTQLIKGENAVIINYLLKSLQEENIKY